jgi:hypothetical protein
MMRSSGACGDWEFEGSLGNDAELTSLIWALCLRPLHVFRLSKEAGVGWMHVLGALLVLVLELRNQNVLRALETAGAVALYLVWV